ncbi:MAG TPA: hypothetical protein VNK41_09390 [Vicinamibacterales bacterium]|nr:hypothetical protein [Vicinamibacterales bacterium]
MADATSGGPDSPVIRIALFSKPPVRQQIGGIAHPRLMPPPCAIPEVEALALRAGANRLLVTHPSSMCVIVFRPAAFPSDVTISHLADPEIELTMLRGAATGRL